MRKKRKSTWSGWLAWLPWLALAFLAGGVLLARRRTAALVGVGVGVALGAALALVALAVAEALVLAGVPASVVPGPVMELLFATVTQGLATAFTIVLVLGVVVALAAWLVRQRRSPGGRVAAPASAGE